MSWDKDLCHDDQWHVKSWLTLMQYVNELRIPRCLPVMQTKGLQMELYLLEDASESGYGAFVYTCPNLDGIRTRILLFSKARAASLKAISLASLELCATVLAVCMYETIKHFDLIAFDKAFFCTDLMIILQHIRNTSTRF